MKKKGIILVVLLVIVAVAILCLNYASAPSTDADNPVTLYDKTTAFLEQEFHRVYDPYYDIQSLTISNWEENGNEATFFYKMTYIYYNRDPDTVEYIQKAKEKGQEQYKILYDDYLKEHEANYQFKVVLNGDTIDLYSNIAPKGVEWVPTKIDDYIMSNWD
ncbi:MAG: hypothetical protein IJ304_03905 [Clostridia bacterium]|nr:hypothetical protein [Clostridia bacterium]